MTYNLPFKSTRTTFSGITVQGSATIGGDVYVSGSLNAINIGNFPIGQGLDLQHGTISSTVTSSSSLSAGPGISIVNSTIINTGTLVPGSGMVISNGTISSTIPGASTLVGGPGIAVGGSTITNTGTLSAGGGIQIANGTISSTVSGGTSTLQAGNGLQESSSTIGMSGTYLGLMHFPNGLVSGTTTATLYNNPIETYGGVILRSASVVLNTPWGGIDFEVNLNGVYSTIVNAITNYVLQTGTAPLITTQTNSEYFVNSQGTVLIRDYGNTEYHIYQPLTVDKFATLPIGAGLSIASSTLYATGGATSSSITPDYVVAASGTLFLGGELPAVGSVVSATIAIINNSTVTGNNFQQRIDVNFNTGLLASYINATLTNVQFTDISGSTIVASWRESGTVNSDTSVYWLLLPQGIPGSSTIYVKLNINTDGSSKLNSTNTGLAPNLSQYYGNTYGDNDTGSVIFNGSIGYNNFSGTILPSTWIGTSATVNNGLYVISSGTTAYASATVLGLSSPAVLDIYGYINITDTSVNNYPEFGFDNPPTRNAQLAFQNSHAGVGYFVDNNGTAGTNIEIYSSNAGERTLGVWGVYWSETSVGYARFNYSDSSFIASSTQTTDLPTAIGAIGAYTPASATIFMQWVRGRSYPPNGVMPTVNVSYPTVTTSIEFQSGVSFINPPSSSSLVVSGLIGNGEIYVSPVGTSTSSSITIKNNGASYGPDTDGTTTNGILEAMKSQFGIEIPKPIRLLDGLFTIHKPLVLYGTIAIDGSNLIPMPSLRGFNPGSALTNNQFAHGVYIQVATDFPAGEYAIAYMVQVNPFFSGQTNPEIPGVEIGNFTLLDIDSSGSLRGAGVNLFGLTNGHIHDLGILGNATPNPTQTASPNGVNVAAFQIQQNYNGGPFNHIERIRTRLSEQDGFFLSDFVLTASDIQATYSQRYDIFALYSSSIDSVGNAPLTLYHPELESTDGNSTFGLSIPSGTFSFNVSYNSAIPSGSLGYGISYPSGMPPSGNLVVSTDVDIITPDNNFASHTNGPYLWAGGNYDVNVFGGFMYGSPSSGTAPAVVIDNGARVHMFGTKLYGQNGVYPLIEQKGTANKSEWIGGIWNQFGTTGTILLSLADPYAITIRGVYNVSDMGFSISTPSLPSSTGTQNAVVNGFGISVKIYQDKSTTLGTGIIDHSGNVATLYQDPEVITLEPGDKIFYSSAVPSNWKWYGH